MSVSLMQAAVADSFDPKEGVLVQMFDEESDVIKDVPMKRIEGRTYDYARETTLPNVAWRALNTAYTESTGITTPYREYLKIIGGEIDIDVALINTEPNRVMSEKKTQMRMKMRALASEWNRAFFEGSELNNPNEMIGLRPRITGSTQLLLNAAGGGALTLPNLDLLLDAVIGEDSKKVLYMNRTVRRKIHALFDNNGTNNSRYVFSIDRDDFGRPVEMYRQAKVRVIETRGSAATLLDFDEAPGATVSASIYCVYYDEDDGLCGLYNGGAGQAFDVRELGELETKPVDRTRFEGYFGLVAHQPRCVARLYGITNV